VTADPNKPLSERCILVVGASSGIGAAVARRAVGAGARVALAGRRRERLAQVIDEAGGGLPVVGDVRRPEDCERIAAEARIGLGGLDALVYASGITPLAWLAEADASHWRSVFETNLFGAVLVTRAALRHLPAGGVLAYLSSDSVGRPRQALAAYSASKAALDEAIRGWRLEHPDQRFLRVVIGPTVGTEAGRGWGGERFAELVRLWQAHGFMTRRHLEAGDLGAFLVEALAATFAHPEIALEDLVVEPTGPKLLLS
jgi:NAD(P)-dependent dehydrogenase (short-subunit alcohol dehydrogenase family)